MSELENAKQQQPAELNRRKPENRWVRILRDAEWDQYQTVRRWLKFARHMLREEPADAEDLPQSSSNIKAA